MSADMTSVAYLAQPISISFQQLALIFANVEAPHPWEVEVKRFTSWGNSLGLKKDGVGDQRFESEDLRSQVLVTLHKLETDFTDDQMMVSHCGLAVKKRASILKKGLRKISGKTSATSHLPGGAYSTSEMLFQKWVVKSPDLWNAEVIKVRDLIDELLSLIPTPAEPTAMGALSQQMGRMSMIVSNQAPAAPAAKTTSQDEAEQIYAELDKLEEFVGQIDNGSLSVMLSPASNYSARVTVRVYFGDEDDGTWSSTWKDEAMGYTKMGHGSFGLYHRSRYIKERQSKYSADTDEDFVLLDVESHPKYENINPGTVTLEGFGMEAWDYEQINGRSRDQTVFISTNVMPEVTAKQLLRRIDEFQSGKVSRTGWNPARETHDLQEFFGNMGMTYVASIADDDPIRIITFYQQLNRQDVFTDLSSISSIATQWAQPKGEGVLGIWNFLYQIILAKELSMRLLTIAEGSYSGFTVRVLSSLIISELWLRNVKIGLCQPKIHESLIHKAATSEDATRATTLINEGHEAGKLGEWQKAVDYYTEAIKIDNSVSSYFTSRALAYLALKQAPNATDDSNDAINLDPKDKLAWSALGDASVGRDRLKRAREAYTTAISLSNIPDETLRKKLEDVDKQISSKIAAINNERDINVAFTLEKAYDDEDYEPIGKTLEFSSKVHERQVEGLIIFAERMKWPWMHEVREAAENVYSQIRSGAVTPFHVVDWIYGITLPGEWMALKLMSSLILLTDSVKALGIAPFYGCSFITKDKSYHRVRNVLGRVLGAMPGVISLCGWIGPCPPVSFDPPFADGLGKDRNGRHVRIRARNVSLVDPPDPHDNVIRIGGGGGSHLGIRPKPEENFPKYVAEIKDMTNWFAPIPPQKIESTIIVQEIVLTALPLESSVDTRNQDTVDANQEYRAAINFDVNGISQKYTLFTNPVFATPPPCRGGPRGPHEIHKRELENFSNIIPAESLKDYTPSEDEIVIVNATGNSADVLARAWCAERGKAAVITRIGGPCFSCTMKTVRELQQKVIIWVS